MPDIAHSFGYDIALDSTGDLAMSDGTQLGQERVLRRLLTNPGAYIWQLSYGAGVARFIGTTTSGQQIAAVARGQLFKENVVARTPTPVVTAQINSDSSAYLNLQYADANTQQTVTLSFPVTSP